MPATTWVPDRFRAGFRPPPGLLASVQWALLAIAMVSLVLALVIISVFSHALPQLRLCAYAGVGWLAWWLLSGYRIGKFYLWKDVLAVLALFVVGVGAGEPYAAVGVLYATLYFRAFYASPEGSIGVAAGFIGADLASMAVVAGPPGAVTALEHGFAGSLALGMAAVMMQLMRSVVSRRRVEARRERTLRRAGNELLGATSPTAVYRAVRRVAAEVVGAPNQVQVSLAMLERLEFRIISADRALDRPAQESRVAASSLPDEVVEQLLGVQPVSAELKGRAGLLQALRISPGLTHVQVIPLLTDGLPHGGFAIATATPLSPEQTEVLVILADECALALSRAAISDDLRRSEGRFRSLVQNSSDLIMAIGPDESFSYLSPSVEVLLGRRLDSERDFNLTEILHPTDSARVLEAIKVTRSERSPGRRLECRVLHHDGGWRHLEVNLTNLLHDTYVRAVVVTGRDITERRELEDQLRHQALHDPLTGLANRALLRDRLEHALRARRDGRSTLGLLSVDLDNFKTINDSYGHAVGDTVLLEVTRRIGECLRPSDTFARLGGDEFAVLVEKLTGTTVVTAIADRIGEVLCQPIRAAFDLEVTVGASIGLITTKYATADAEAILRDADIALYQAKSEGKGRCVEFHPRLHEQAVQRMHVETGLRRALDRGEMQLLYQPILSGVRHRLVGVEALLRWRDPDRLAVVSPDDFIEVAEATGLIVPIGRWVLYESCRQLGEWRRSYSSAKQLRLSVNVSARQLQQASLIEDVRGAISSSGIDPHQLMLEVTESTIVKDVKHASDQLRALRDIGIRIAIDDFGTGHSSLAQLQHLPVDELKIDRSFMAKLTDGKAGAAVAESVVNLGRALCLSVVIEGVETAEQVALLEAMSSDPMLQGFYFAEPLEPRALEAMIVTEEDRDAGQARPAKRAKRPPKPTPDARLGGRGAGDLAGTGGDSSPRPVGLSRRRSIRNAAS
ncbi:MAG TPA: EAL domain-containing protein [Candidatus Dormibacteraeota bacterium]|nr:EAL domain-containing protein [Candidatus Dormibacteraeota bacterium]